MSETATATTDGGDQLPPPSYQSVCDPVTGSALTPDAPPFVPAALQNQPSDSTTDEPGSPPRHIPDFVPPSEELVQKIVDQVEFYFSDANITKDAFLLKHVKRNKEGFVSLKLISSFKRVKHLAKDWQVVAHALKNSKKLEINEAGTKLRRVDPLPPFDQTAPSRTIVAINLPNEKATIECVAEMFKGCGEISLIRILRPGNPVPGDVRSFANKHPEMVGAASAVVEFVRTESAHNAVQKEWVRKDGEDFRVVQLNAPVGQEKKTKKTKKTPRIFDLEYSSSCQSSSEAEDRKLRLQRRCSSPMLMDPPSRRWSRDSGTDSGSSGSRSRSGSGFFERRYSTDSDSYMSRSRSNSGISLADIRRLSIESSDCCCRHRRGSRDSEGYGSSRSRCDSGASDLRRNSLDWACRPKDRRVSQPEAVLRFPRGPDGGRGFLPPQQLCHTLIE